MRPPVLLPHPGLVRAAGFGLLLLILAGIAVAFADQNPPDAPPAVYDGRAPVRRIA